MRAGVIGGSVSVRKSKSKYLSEETDLIYYMAFVTTDAFGTLDPSVRLDIDRKTGRPPKRYSSSSRMVSTGMTGKRFHLLQIT